MHTIELKHKYQVGDIVYLMRHNKMVKAEILRIRITDVVSRLENNKLVATCNLKYVCKHISIDVDDDTYSEEFLFKGAEYLVSNLLTNIT